MPTLIVSSLRAISSVFAPGMLKIFVFAFICTIIALIGFVFVASYFFDWLSIFLESDYWWAGAVSWVGGFGSGLLAWMFFPTFMPIIINFFDESMARKIEAHTYPTILAKNPTPLMRELLHDAKFTLTAGIMTRQQLVQLKVVCLLGPIELL